MCPRKFVGRSSTLSFLIVLYLYKIRCTLQYHRTVDVSAALDRLHLSCLPEKDSLSTLRSFPLVIFCSKFRELAPS